MKITKKTKGKTSGDARSRIERKKTSKDSEISKKVDEWQKSRNGL